MAREGAPRHLGQLGRVTVRWRPGAISAIRKYVRALHGPRRSRRQHANEPYWLLLPRWLYAAADANARRRLHPRFLDDVAWGQYCLFLCVRIHDDVLDGQADDRRLVFIADQLLIESRRAFEPHVPSAFWSVYWELLETTTTAILEADEFQRKSVPARDGLFVHARVSSIFKAGAAALCLATRRRHTFDRIAEFADQIAIVSQVLDDLSDMFEDAEAGRVNSVASLLAGIRTRGTQPQSVVRAAGTALLYGDGAERLVSALRDCHNRAAAAVSPLRLEAASIYLAGVAANIERLAAMLHHARVEAIFGKALTAAARHTG